MSHVHNPWTCPAHVSGCGCPDLPNSACNPYHVAGCCPDDIDVIPLAGAS